MAPASPDLTQVHHKKKRRGADLLDQQYWVAVSAAYHRQIETKKDWARTKGYLRGYGSAHRERIDQALGR
jgi:hypothetical protein